MNEAGQSFPAPKYSHFTQGVRRYAPSQLLPLLANMTVRDNPNFTDFEDTRRLPPWSMAAIARESAVRETEYRSDAPTPADVLRLASVHHRVFVPPEGPAVTAIVGPIFYEQFHWQVSLFEEMTRSILLFSDPTHGPVFDWSAELGMDLAAAMRANIVLDGIVKSHGGSWSPDFLKDWNPAGWAELATNPSDVAELAKRFTSTLPELRAAALNGPVMPADMARYPYNPLQTRPLVDLGDIGIVAPVGPMLTRALLPRVLYYRGADRWPNDFSRTLGARHESYVWRDSSRCGVPEGRRIPHINDS